jgi:hypothetical protein
MVEHAHDHDKLGVDIQAKLDGLNIAGGLLHASFGVMRGFL